MNEVKSAFKMACVYTGTVIGAGFASGQEIWRFFGRFGTQGVWGIILAALLLSVIGAGMMLKIYRLKIRSYEEFCKATFGRKASGFVALVSAAFMFACFCVMLAGSGAVFDQELGLSPVFGVSFLALVCFMTFLFDIRGVLAVNSILSPLMLIGMFILGGYALLYSDRGVMSSFAELLALNDNWLISAFIYVSYNILAVPAVITPMQSRIASPRAALAGGSAGGLALGAGGLMVLIACAAEEYITEPLPALAAAIMVGEHFKFYYCLVIFMSMMTAAVSCGMGFIKYMGDRDGSAVWPALVCFSGGSLAMLGFVRLVKHLYTLFGYLGAFIALVLLKDSIIELALFVRKKTRENEIKKAIGA